MTRVAEQHGIPPLGDRELASFQRIVLAEAGIELPDHKRALIVARLWPRLRALGLPSFADYLHIVGSPHGGEERVRMIDAICTNETHFFREPDQFAYLERCVMPAWKRSPARRVRALSAACSTGEEPYSLAMVLLDNLPPALGWSVEIVAGDISTRALSAAREGLFPIARAREIPDHLLRPYMLRGKGAQEGVMKAGPEISRVVRFVRLNLADEELSVPGRFDLVLCRNVLIYFADEARTRALTNLVDRLAPGAHLFLGHAETISQAPELARRLLRVQPAGYRLAPESG